MSNKSWVLKGNICYSKDQNTLAIEESAYLVCEDGVSKGVFLELPSQYRGLPLKECGNQLIIPGLVDLHIHAPQFAFRGLGMDLELLDWLNTHTFPEESKYKEIEYAKGAYDIFVENMRQGATTRASIFATVHVDATTYLMEQLEAFGMKAFVGKVNMDRNTPEYLCEESAEKSVEDTLKWLKDVSSRFECVKPILTPRFTPSCTDEVMKLLKEVQIKYGLPVQSHISENKGEIEWVKELCPNTQFYGEAYDQFGLFGKDHNCIMAHAVYSTTEEIALMRENGVTVAHCPQSNTNLASGIAAIRMYLEEGLKVGLGSDVAGGAHSSIFRAMTDAIQVSKLRWRIMDETLKPLTVEEAFYMGTKGGGQFFGKVGSFEAGYECDAIILDDSNLKHLQPLTVRERLERLIYLSDERNIVGKYIAGQEVMLQA